MYIGKPSVVWLWPVAVPRNSTLSQIKLPIGKEEPVAAAAALSLVNTMPRVTIPLLTLFISHHLLYVILIVLQKFFITMLMNVAKWFEAWWKWTVLSSLMKMPLQLSSQWFLPFCHAVTGEARDGTYRLVTDEVLASRWGIATCLLTNELQISYRSSWNLLYMAYI